MIQCFTFRSVLLVIEFWWFSIIVLLRFDHGMVTSSTKMSTILKSTLVDDSMSVCQHHFLHSSELLKPSSSQFPPHRSFDDWILFLNETSKEREGGMINWYFVSGLKLWNRIIWQSLGLGKPFLKVFNLDYRIHLFLISVFPIIPFSNYFWHFPMFFISCFRIISDTSSPFSDVRQQKSCRLSSVSLSLNRNN